MEKKMILWQHIFKCHLCDLTSDFAEETETCLICPSLHNQAGPTYHEIPAVAEGKMLVL